MQVLVANRTLGALEPAPRGSLAPYGGSQSPCAALMRDRPAQVVYGPGTFLNRAVASVNQQLGLIRAADQRYIVARRRAPHTGLHWPAGSQAASRRRRRWRRPRSRPSG